MATMFLQEVTLLYGQYVNKLYLTQPDTTCRGVVLLIPIVIIGLFVFLRHPLTVMPPGGVLTSALFCLVSIVSLYLSSQNCLRPKYILADFLRFAPTWITLFVAYHVFASIHRRQGLSGLLKWYDLFALLAMFDGLITATFGAAFYGYHISNWFYIFLIGWTILNDRISDFKMQVILGGVLLVTVLSSKRTNFTLVAFAIIASLAIRLIRGKDVTRLLGTLTGMFLVGVVAQSVAAQFTGGITLWEIGQDVFDNLTQIVVDEDYDESYLFRVNEVENVKAYFQSHPMQSVFGIGFGGEIPMLYDTGPMTDTIYGNMRHVHKGYWLYFLRHGYVGLLLLGIFVIVSTWVLYQTPSPAPMVTASCAVYCAGRVLASFGGNLMMEDLDLPIAAALGFACSSQAGAKGIPTTSR